jgi:tetratricopeptide (TPR) repeat protein
MAWIEPALMTSRRICSITLGACALALVLCWSSPMQAGPLDEMALERWAKLKEAERYQLNVAEKFYREKQYKVAAAEYEKFLKLYEKSEGAPFAQLKWSHCQVELRNLNAAIKDGYQSVLDYYPDSPEAPIAALLIGRTHRDGGDPKLAKKAYTKAVTTYPKHFAAIMARFDLVDIAAKENDLPTQMALLEDLTFNVDRKGPGLEQTCAKASQQLARLKFRAGNFEDGIKALEKSCAADALIVHLLHPNLGQLPHVVAELTSSTDEATKKLGEKLADAAAGWLKTQVGSGLTDEKSKPRAIELLLAAADVRRAARQPDKQKAIYEEMLTALGANDQVLGHLAHFYKENKQMDLARSTYAKFKEVAEGQGLIAASYAEEKQYDKAAELYRKLAISDAKATAKWLTAAAMAYRHGSKPDQAIAIYRELLTADAANAAEYHFQIAETLYYAGRWEACITAYRGTDRFPHNLQQMARANRNLKKFDEAISLYNQIMVSSQPQASWALYQIALTHEEAGRKEDAIKFLKQVCDRHPTSQEGSQAHARLNEKYKITVTKGGAKD